MAVALQPEPAPLSKSAQIEPQPSKEIQVPDREEVAKESLPAINQPTISQPTGAHEEDLPPDFWDTPPVSKKPSQDEQDAESTIDVPLFSELQTLFPGKVLHIESSSEPDTSEPDEGEE